MRDTVLPQQQHDTSDDGEIEAGQPQKDGQIGDEWEDYVISMPASPPPQSAESPPEDIGSYTH